MGVAWGQAKSAFVAWPSPLAVSHPPAAGCHMPHAACRFLQKKKKWNVILRHCHTDEGSKQWAWQLPSKKVGRHKPPSPTPTPSPFAMSSNVMKRAGRAKERKRERRRESQSNMMFRLFCVLLLLQNTFCMPARCTPYPTLYGIYMYLLRLICGWAHISLSHVSWVAQIVRHLNYCLGEATRCWAWEDGGEWCAPLMLIEFAPQRVQQAPPMEPSFSLDQVKQIKSNLHCSSWVSSFKSNCNLGSANWNLISIIVLWVRVSYPSICRRHVTRIPEISVLQVSPAQLQVNCELILVGQQTLKEQRLWFHTANSFHSLDLFALWSLCL